MILSSDSAGERIKMRFPLLLLFVPAVAHALTLPEFQERMKKHVESLSGRVTASVRIEVLGKDQALFSHNEDTRLIPASGAKLLTATAALEKLGAGYTFDTQVLRRGEDLLLVSDGDPYLVSERLWLLARDVARYGVKKVASIRVATGAFGETYRGLTEFEDSGEPFTALVSPVALNFNSLEIHVVPSDGKKPVVEMGPVATAFAEIKAEVSQNGGKGHQLSVKPLGMHEGKEGFLVSGSIGRNGPPVTVYGIVAQPEAHIASVFAALLRKEGVSVAKDFGGVLAESSPSGELVADEESLPLQDLVRLYDTYSNNFMAEMTFLALGAASGGKPATVVKAQAAMAQFLARHPACKDSTMTNGSGLSWDTRVSARCFTETLAFAYREFRVFADLLGSLPSGGETGTLKSRFKRGGEDFDAEKVRAKTGTLWSKQLATSLTGITSTASGEKVLFSLIENDQRNDKSGLRVLKEWEDKCVELVQQLRL
jgi:D-alanyl-D-alanine carboxypeptidase/D-alanyl-D-alanine-endopeptidase (penicillin-binding protein 4)